MKLSKVSVPYRALKDIGTLLAVVVFSGNLSFQTLDFRFVFFASLIFGGVVSVSLVWEYIVWRRYDYFFEDESLRITHGVFRRDEREIPYGRIQNVDIKKNIVQRILGIAKVGFETAGGSSTEASLKFVEKEEAREIQEKVRRFKNRGKDEDEKTGDRERENLFELSSSDLLAYSFLSVNTKSMVLAFTVFGIFGSIGAGLGKSSFSPVVVLVFLGLFSVAGLWIFNAASNFIQYYDFKLWRERDTLEYERGLLNRSEGSIPVEKVQGISIEENFLKRQLDYATLKIETAGLSDEQELKSNMVAVPLAKYGTVKTFAQELENFQAFDLSSIPSRARRRYLGRYSIGLGLLLIGGIGVNSFINQFNYIVLLSLVPVAAVAAHLKWANRGFEAQEDYFISMNGFWNRKTSVTPYYRVQNLIQTETILQRRWNLSTLTVDTAGNLVTSDSRAVDLDVKENFELRDEVFEKFKKALKESKKA